MYLPSPSILDVQAIEKTKEIALRGERVPRPYLRRDCFACLQAVIPIMPALKECVSMCALLYNPTPPPQSYTRHQRHCTHNPPPRSSSRLQKLSIARFICVSHYRKWNVVSAKRINSAVGEISLLLHAALTLSHLNLWWR